MIQDICLSSIIHPRVDQLKSIVSYNSVEVYFKFVQWHSPQNHQDIQYNGCMYSPNGEWKNTVELSSKSLWQSDAF